MSDLRDSFHYFDPQGKGYIHRNCVKAILQNFTMKNETNCAIEAEINTQVQGDQVDWTDVLAIVQRKYKQGANEQEMKEMFKVFDKKGVESVPPREMKAVLKG